MKKITSLILALAMVFAMGVSVFAEGEEAVDPNVFKTTATVNVPDIDVTVPKSAPLFINPMGFSVLTASGKAATGDEEAYQVTKNKIVSPVFQIQNASPMKLKVSVVGYAAAVKGEDGKAPFTIVKAPISAKKLDDEGKPTEEDNTAQEVFIYAYFDKVSGEGEEASMKDPTDFAAAGTKAYPLCVGKVGTDDKAQEVGEIAPAADGEPTILGFKFLGDVNTAEGVKDYANGGKADVQLTFTFKPIN